MGTDKKFIISGGGTGGHVFPAIAIANAVKAKCPSAEILFVGAKGRMEMEKVPEAGYQIIGLNISGIQRKLTLKNISTFFKLIGSLVKAKKIIKQFKPDIVIGVGGYASGPVLRVASNLKIPTLIQEQNSYPGITNRILSKNVNRICVAYEGMEKYFPEEKIILTGNPVRQDIYVLDGKKEMGLKIFGLDNTKKSILVVGGSLGARTINEAILNGLELFKKNNIQLIWQTGKAFFATAQQACNDFKDAGIAAYAFITRMDYAYASADLVISRAGAIAISEICVTKKPAILIPSPNVAEDHQTKNALSLSKKTAAILVKDNEARDILVKEAIGLINDKQMCEKIVSNITRFAHKNAADSIADIILDMIKKQE
ncbi:MAG: undecaprenyldiphospho-muramoylpentapeptide beta-N-acetylglucosaminyltransferase [Bacteroidales bacterium]|jgi:UDP-N-acetylglucosamine--N-acetylmuramyl-(pentapeptide) pyrophosphoryl-undecaprenol N-acetylglucosamine transferase|nr:undecaprenyldiphospho-muramoylpentapeptide beta-N-acetylglucosaminyltransferase [Bacteroidales bacterium]MDD4214657.1 undecaprenyldiphospho-muramoylpentapeptide beta-N-acetylglucosaminyltransferase [Bacteroidales bacterium]